MPPLTGGRRPGPGQRLLLLGLSEPEVLSHRIRRPPEQVLFPVTGDGEQRKLNGLKVRYRHRFRSSKA